MVGCFHCVTACSDYSTRHVLHIKMDLVTVILFNSYVFFFSCLLFVICVRSCMPEQNLGLAPIRSKSADKFCDILFCNLIYVLLKLLKKKISTYFGCL